MPDFPQTSFRTTCLLGKVEKCLTCNQLRLETGVLFEPRMNMRNVVALVAVLEITSLCHAQRAKLSREATRYAIVHGTASGNTATVAQIQGIVTSRSVGLDTSNFTTTVTFTPDETPGSTVKVAVAYSFYPIAPFIPVGPITLSSTSQMVIYQ
jgi:hypothetical protein